MALAIAPIEKLQAATPPNVNQSVGVIRATACRPKLDFSLLKRAARNVALVPNPSASPGCSPVLRALFVQSGLPFAIRRELATSGDNAGHSTGNALDIVAVPGTIDTEAALGDLTEFASTMSGCFNRIVHRDDNYSTYNAEYGAEQIPDGLFHSTGSSLHVDSYLWRIEAWLNSGEFKSERDQVLSLLAGLDPQFTGRNVFYVNKGVSKATTQPTTTVNFW